jgi:Gram-negative bacterial TonB protein C-terminal
MTSKNSITSEFQSSRDLCTAVLRLVATCCCIWLLTLGVTAQRFAILGPDGADQSRQVGDDLRIALADKVQILDEMLSHSAFDSSRVSTPFNMTTDDARRVAMAIGCDFLILVRADTVRRSASDRTEYYDANAAIYLVSARSGQLIRFILVREEAAKPESAAKKLRVSIGVSAQSIIKSARDALRSELDEKPFATSEEIPEPNSPAAKGFRQPVPYKRFKPTYTADAAYYDIAATIDIDVYLKADGSISDTLIKRWAGYGLDQSAENAIRTMNWRPAERNGRSIPLRFLIRYNFKRVEKDPDN